MTAYTSLANPALNQDKAITEVMMKALRDNPIALSEGASGAPRIEIGALKRLVAGNSVRASLSAISSVSTSSGQDVSSTVTISVFQGGTLRITQTSTAVTGSPTRLNRLRRKRGGSITTLVGSTSTNPITTDVTCIPGDQFIIECVGTSGSSGNQTSLDVSLQTDGGDLYPAPGLEGGLTGNAVLT